MELEAKISRMEEKVEAAEDRGDRDEVKELRSELKLLREKENLLRQKELKLMDQRWAPQGQCASLRACTALHQPQQRGCLSGGLTGFDPATRFIKLVEQSGIDPRPEVLTSISEYCYSQMLATMTPQAAKRLYEGVKKLPHTSTRMHLRAEGLMIDGPVPVPTSRSIFLYAVRGGKPIGRFVGCVRPG